MHNEAKVFDLREERKKRGLSSGIDVQVVGQAVKIIIRPGPSLPDITDLTFTVSPERAIDISRILRRFALAAKRARASKVTT